MPGVELLEEQVQFHLRVDCGKDQHNVASESPKDGKRPIIVNCLRKRARESHRERGRERVCVNNTSYVPRNSC